jgi:exodeoxyribonuclease-5
MMTAMTTWSPQQEKAKGLVSKWIKTSKKKCKQVFYLAGYAGTGKTTLATSLAEDVKGDVLYGAFTGKAALVMRSKGCKGASTIHSMIYSAEVDEKTGLVTYSLNKNSDVGSAGLVVIDECSMVDEALGKDLLSFGTKVLVIGDPFQLPPVKGTGFFTSGEPDFLLTEVHRQARDNPIIRMSMDIREGRKLEHGTFGESRVIGKAELDPQDVLSANQVIVGRNATRTLYNSRIRNLRYDPPGLQPVLGEKLICLKNKRPMGLLNGSMWEVHKAKPNGDNVAMDLLPIEDTNKTPTQVTVPYLFFDGRENEIDPLTRRYIEEFTYGHAITCHKAQGSQWDNVMVFDESYAFRDDAARWLYTAVTRAAKQLTLVAA